MRRWLAAFALSVLVGHHVGTAFGGLGEVGPTRWADWIDLAVPYAVLGTAAAALLAARVDRLTWALLAVAGVVYVQGHGIHLAANSVGNVAPGETEHLWDEVVGHYIWYSGFALVVVALARAAAGTSYAVGWLGHVAAVLVGFTWFTNTIEGGTPVLGIGVAVGMLAWSRRLPRTTSTLLVAAFATALVLLAVWGGWHRGFPQFSELGWV